MRSARPVLLAMLFVHAAAAHGQARHAGFLTIKGTDTATVERFSEEGNVLTSDMDFRQQKAQVHFAVRFHPDGTAEHAELTNTAGGVVTTIRYEFGRDSLRIHRVEGGTPSDFVVKSPVPVYAWMPASVALIEHAVKATHLAVGDSTTIQTINIRQMTAPAPAALRRISPDSMKVLTGTYVRLSRNFDILSARSTGNGLDFVRIP